MRVSARIFTCSVGIGACICLWPCANIFCVSVSMYVFMCHAFASLSLMLRRVVMSQDAASPGGSSKSGRFGGFDDVRPPRGQCVLGKT